MRFGNTSNVLVMPDVPVSVSFALHTLTSELVRQVSCNASTHSTPQYGDRAVLQGKACSVETGGRKENAKPSEIEGSLFKLVERAF